jgi:predicted glycosyltransferase
MELLQARARAVVVPFAGGNETEQTLRAELFASRGLVEMIGEHSLTVHALAAGIDRAASKPRPSAPPVDLGGAARSARMIARWAQERR